MISDDLRNKIGIIILILGLILTFICMRLDNRGVFENLDDTIPEEPIVISTIDNRDERVLINEAFTQIISLLASYERELSCQKQYFVSDVMYYDILIPGIDELYNKRNEDIENFVIRLYNHFMVIYESYNVQTIKPCINIISEENPELILFSVEDNKVSCTAYDIQEHRMDDEDGDFGWL